ncbi:MAG: tetratricopeptide repeat protein [candidate division Zixibacteria bacterium]|nr:tetratricopeptide repeat protein [candidate division Zixibacteria bacterium]
MAKKKERKQKKKRSPVRSWRFDKLWKSVRFPLLLVGIAFVPRLVALVELTDSPIFYHPAIDSKVYHELAKEIAAGDVIGKSTFWQAPLYPYFLGMIYWLFGVKVIAAKLIQMLLGAVNCYLIYLLAVRIFERRIALVADGIAVLYGPFIFFSSELLAPVLLNFLILLTLLLSISYHRSPRPATAIGIGLLLGVAQIGHGLIVAFLPVLIGLLILKHWRSDRDTRAAIRASVYLLIGFLPLIVATSVRNYALDRELVFVSSNLGANLYLGNHPNYDSTTAIRPGLEWDEFIQQAAAEGHITPAQSSSYFSGKALEWMTGDPVGFAGLLAKKLYLLPAGEEIKRNLDIYHFKRYSLLLDVLIWRWFIAFPSGLVLPLAIGWMILFCLARSPDEHRRERWLLLLFVLSQAAAILLFFISTRYRLVMLPVSIIFASAMFWHVFHQIKAGQLKRIPRLVLLLAALMIICNLPRIKAAPRDRAENLFYEGLAYTEAGDYRLGIERYREALAIAPDYAMAEYNLALNYDRSGRPAEAAKALDAIVRKNRNSFVAHLVAGRAQLDRGNLVEAEQLFRAVLDMNPNSVEAMVNLGHLYRVQKDSTRALAELRAALAINPKAYKAYNQIGAVYLERKLIRQAEANFRRACELDRSYTTALNNLAIVCSQTNRIDEADRLLGRAIKLNQDDVTTLLNLGALRLKQYKPDIALELFDRAVALSPKMAQAHHYRGIALASQRMNREAAAAFRKALQLDPNYAPARLELEKVGQQP